MISLTKSISLYGTLPPLRPTNQNTVSHPQLPPLVLTALPVPLSERWLKVIVPDSHIVDLPLPVSTRSGIVNLPS